MAQLEQRGPSSSKPTYGANAFVHHKVAMQIVLYLLIPTVTTQDAPMSSIQKYYY